MRSDVEVLRRIAAALPGAVEGPTWGGDPGFKVGRRLFAHLYPDGRLIVRCPPDERAALVADDPQTYSFDNPEMPFLEVRLERVNEHTLRELLTEAWLTVAPKRVVRDFLAAREVGPAS